MFPLLSRASVIKNHFFLHVSNVPSSRLRLYQHLASGLDLRQFGTDRRETPDYKHAVFYPRVRLRAEFSFPCATLLAGH